MLSAVGMRRMDQHRPAADRKRRVFATGSTGLGLHVHVEFSQFRQGSRVRIQIKFRPFPGVVGLHFPRLVRPNHKHATAAAFVLQKLEGIGPLVTNVHQSSLAGQVPCPLQPQQAFSRRAFAMLLPRFARGRFHAMVQYLIGQTQDRTRFRLHRQNMMTNISAGQPFSNLTQFVRQLAMRSIIQLGGVMDQQDVSALPCDVLQGVVSQRLDNGGMRHFLASHQAIQPFQVLRLGHFTRQRAARMAAQLIERFHQPRGPPTVPQFRLSKNGLAQRGASSLKQRHGMTPPYLVTVCSIGSKFTTCGPTL